MEADMRENSHLVVVPRKTLIWLWCLGLGDHTGYSLLLFYKYKKKKKIHISHIYKTVLIFLELQISPTYNNYYMLWMVKIIHISKTTIKKSCKLGILQSLYTGKFVVQTFSCFFLDSFNSARVLFHCYNANKTNCNINRRMHHSFYPTDITLDGVLVMVQTGYVFGVGLGWHS